MNERPSGIQIGREDEMGLRVFLLGSTAFAGSLASAAPSDEPLTPKQWSDKMQNACWLVPIMPRREIRDPFGLPYSPELPKRLKAIGLNGCRLHLSAGGRGDRGRAGGSIHDRTGRLYQENVDFTAQVVDDFAELDMGVLLQIGVHYPDEYGTAEGSTAAEQRNLIIWEQLSGALKDKSHNLIMCPVIEYHGYSHLKKNRSDMVRAYDRFLDKATLVFRKDNPTRIMAYKPWGAARGSKGRAMNVAAAIRFPYGEDPAPDSGKPYYYLLLIGNVGDPGQSIPKTLMPAVAFRGRTGIEVVSDHWYAGRGARTNVDASTLENMDTVYAWMRKNRVPNCVSFPRGGYWDAEREDWAEDDITRSVVEVITKHRW